MYSVARITAMLGSVVVWLLGTLSCLFFLAWFIDSPEGDPSPGGSPASLLVVAAVALADVLLCIAAGKAIGPAVIRVSVIAVAVLALAGVLVTPRDSSGALPVAFGVLSFLVPTLAYALVLPIALLGRRDLRAATTAMAGVTVAFLVAFAVQSASDAQLWIGVTDLFGAFTTGVLAVLLLGALAAKKRSEALTATSLETVPLGVSPNRSAH